MPGEAAGRRPGFPIGLTVAVLICEVILVSLGVWQLQRMHWKAGVLAHVAALRHAPAVPAGPVLARQAQGEDVAYTRTFLDCPGLARAAFVEVFALRDGAAGVRLVSACPLQDGAYGSILVDRGFVADTVSARPPVDPADRTPVRVTGVLRSPDARSLLTPARRPVGRLWYWRDTAGMSAALGAARPAPVFLAAETSTNPDWQALSPVPVPADIPNNHFTYALTWFGLAAGLAGVYLAMLFRRRAVP